MALAVLKALPAGSLLLVNSRTLAATPGGKRCSGRSCFGDTGQVPAAVPLGLGDRPAASPRSACAHPAVLSGNHRGSELNQKQRKDQETPF